MPKLFIYTNRPALQAPIIQHAIHLLVSRHEVPLKDFYELQGDNQTDGDEGTIENEVRAK